MRTAVLAVLAASLISGATVGEARPRLRVFAAASLTEVVAGLAADYDAARVETSFGGSSALARQIRDGAPADVYLSAHPEWIDFLRRADAIVGESVVLARTSLVCIAARTDALARRRPGDPRALLQALGPQGRLAIADEGVPAGEYTRAALAHSGLLEAFRPHLVGQRDVRAVLHIVERGELPAGFVYATDARLADVETLFAFDAATHPPIEYRAALVRDARNAEAGRRFLEHLQSAPVRSLLESAGFTLP